MVGHEYDSIDCRERLVDSTTRTQDVLSSPIYEEMAHLATPHNEIIMMNKVMLIRRPITYDSVSHYKSKFYSVYYLCLIIMCVCRVISGERKMLGRR